MSNQFAKLACLFSLSLTCLGQSTLVLQNPTDAPTGALASQEIEESQIAQDRAGQQGPKIAIHLSVKDAEAIALKNTYNIRVINLSLGRGIPVSYTQDPLGQAVESAWQAGIVVVVAAGNYGRLSLQGSNGFGTITAPGNDPLVLTVGAMKSNGSTQPSAETKASFSSKGPTTYDHVVKPDIMAPGNGIVSLAAPGATLESSFPGELVTIGLMLPALGVLLMQPDVGQTMLLSSLCVTMLFLAGLSYYWLAAMAGDLGRQGLQVEGTLGSQHADVERDPRPLDQDAPGVPAPRPREPGDRSRFCRTAWWVWT